MIATKFHTGELKMVQVSGASHFTRQDSLNTSNIFIPSSFVLPDNNFKKPQIAVLKDPWTQMLKSSSLTEEISWHLIHWIMKWWLPISILKERKAQRKSHQRKIMTQVLLLKCHLVHTWANLNVTKINRISVLHHKTPAAQCFCYHCQVKILSEQQLSDIVLPFVMQNLHRTVKSRL